MDSQEEKATSVSAEGEMLKMSGQRKNHSQGNLKVSLLTRCNGEKFSVSTGTNSYRKVHCMMKSQTSHEKTLEEHSLLTREYFFHFSVEVRQGSSLEGIQTSTLGWKLRTILYDLAYLGIAKDIT